MKFSAFHVTMSVRPPVGDHAGDVVDTSDAEVQSSVVIFSDESSFDEVFSISGNDFPAYGDLVEDSPLWEELCFQI
jgi:hypothetical protein